MDRGTRRHANMRPIIFRSIGALLVLAATAAGCRNACQSTCVQLAEFSRECGISVSDADVDACIADQADAPDEARPICRESGGGQDIDSLLSCDDMPLFWGEDLAGGDP